MPSFRAVLTIGDVLPGRRPDEVLSTAAASLSQWHTVESQDIQVVARQPQIVLRFTVEASSTEEETMLASASARRMRAAVSSVATTGSLQVLRRMGGRWKPTLTE